LYLEDTRYYLQYSILCNTAAAALWTTPKRLIQCGMMSSGHICTVSHWSPYDKICMQSLSW